MWYFTLNHNILNAYKYLAWLILYALLALTQVLGQNKKDTLLPKKPFAPTSIRIFTNIYLPAQQLFSNKFQSFEATVEWWQKKGYAFVGELGYAKRTRTENDYSVQGMYFRAGMELGFWERQPERRVNGSWQMGARLAGSSFSYANKSTVISPVWGNIVLQDKKQGLFCLWIEWHLSLRAKIGKRFMMGPMIKAKNLLYAPNTTLTGKPPEIVGFGVRRGLQGEVGYWVGVLF